MHGFSLVSESLKTHGVDTLFYLLSGPTTHYVQDCIDAGIRCIDVRHEQAAAMAAHAYARVARKVSVCTAGSGPGTVNLLQGVATAYNDAMPMLVLGGAAPLKDADRGAFHDIDQVNLLRPITKWSVKCMDPYRIPEYIHTCLQRAISGRPGPVFLDLPADVLYTEIDADKVRRPRAPVMRPRVSADPDQVRAAVEQLLQAKRPIIMTGSGALLSHAEQEIQALVEHLGIPFFPTPQGRGIVPDDHPLCWSGARSRAFKSADTVLLIGSRINYMIRHLNAPAFRPDVAVIQVEIDPSEPPLGSRVTHPVIGDAARVVAQILAELKSRTERPSFDQGWLGELRSHHEQKLAEIEDFGQLSQQPIHPLRLCYELGRLLPRDAILTVDGQEILNYGRQSISTFVPGHRLNSGTFGCIGTGIPFALGAKAAKPDKLVVALTGDGSFGMNGFELDTAIRHRMPLLVVISNNGGWTSNAIKLAGRDLGFTRYEAMFAPLGCHAEFVEAPDAIRPALERGLAAVRDGKVAVVNVITDPGAKAQTAPFSGHPGLGHVNI